MNSEQSARVAELLEWLVVNPTYKKHICEDGDVTTDLEILETMEALEEIGYYELIITLLLKNDMSPSVNDAMLRLAYTKIAESVRLHGAEKVELEFKSFFDEEIHKQEKRTGAY